MDNGVLPEDGELRLGPVVLPAGSRIVPVEGSGAPVAWATVQKVPDAGRLWSALSDLHPVTGLVPVLLSGSPGESFFFCRPADISELDHLDGAGVLASRWDDAMPSEEEEAAEPLCATMRAPFSRRFPGVALGEDAKLSMARVQEVLASLPPARLGLVAAGRPADVLPLVGWLATGQFQNPLPIAAVLRTWEARFGARLLEIGPGAEIRLLVERPPRSEKAAERVAAEHFAFCDECGGKGLKNVSEITPSLIDAPMWSFWWD
jgi:hypothetical protein